MAADDQERQAKGGHRLIKTLLTVLAENTLLVYGVPFLIGCLVVGTYLVVRALGLA